jgi:NAD(P)H-hydrate epimerase
LTGQSIAEVQADREGCARHLARRLGVVVLLKGNHTVITDGEQLAVNKNGNPGMARGGSGDVLTGVIAALLCQRMTPYDAAVLGAHVHGLAGDLAREKLGEVGMIATDLVDFLPAAFLRSQ